jgi:hypothetical protein
MLSLKLGVAAGNQVALRTGPFWGWTVGRRHQRHGTRPVRRVRRADCAAQVKTRPRTITRRLGATDRQSLLLGTALALTLLIGSLLGATPAHADATCPPGTFPPPGPIAIINPGDDISCFNVYDHSNAGNVIDLETNAANEFINLYNSGILTGASGASPVDGILAYTGQVNSPITIQNVASVAATSTFQNA